MRLDAVGDIGGVIRARRQARRMSLARLAELAGCTKGYLSMVERGQRGASETMVRALDEALGLGGELAQRSLPEGVRRLGEILRSSGSLDEAYRSGELRKLVGESTA